MKTVGKQELKKQYRALQDLNNEYSGFIGNLRETYDLSESEKEKIESMQRFFEHTTKLYVQLEKLVS